MRSLSTFDADLGLLARGFDCNGVPQRLKPCSKQNYSGTAEATPLFSSTGSGVTALCGEDYGKAATLSRRHAAFAKGLIFLLLKL
jgi:hypothetical protein